jgi:divalent metal cation (Fe/Co/Zn/Cd) transporter
VLIAVTLALRPDLTVDEVRRTAQELRDRIEEGEPIVSHVFFRLDSHRVDPPARAP